MSPDRTPKLPQRSLGGATDAPISTPSVAPSVPNTPKVEVPIPPLPQPAPAAAHVEADEFEVTLDDADEVDDLANVTDPWGDGQEEVSSRGVAIETVGQELRARPPPPPIGQKDSFEMLMEGAAELFQLGDFSGSLEIVEKALEIKQQDPAALAFLQKNQLTLMKMFESKLSGLQKRPRVRVDPGEIMWLSLDHRAGFVLAQIDGLVSYEEVLQLSGMGRFDTLRILAKLCEEGVIESV